VTIAVPKAITVTQIAVDPNATCGDGGSSSTADYRVETSPDGTTWSVADEGVFGVADRGRLNPLIPAAGSATGVRFVRFTMLEPQVFDIGGACPGAFTGCDFIDMSEIEVYGS
jgi:extracellular elastinolytic metalloproteinase